MKPFADRPIHQKLMSSLLLTSVVVMLLMEGTYFANSYFTLLKSTERQLTTLGQITASNSTASLLFDNQEDAQETLTALSAEPHVTAAAIYDQEGRLFSRYPLSFAIARFPAAPGATGYRISEGRLSGFQPMLQRERQVGTLYLEFDIGSVMREWLAASLRVGLQVMAAALLVAYILSRLLQKQISRPIRALADTAAEISTRRDFSLRTTKHGLDEIGQLTDAFNQMLETIQEREGALCASNEALREENMGRQHSEEALREAKSDLERKVTERTAELQAAKDRAESSDRLKSEFLATMSHELRTPLNAIIGFTGTMLMRLPGPINANQEKQLTTIQSSARHLLSLINDLLDVAKIESGKIELKFEPTSCRDVLDEVTAVCRPLAEKKGLRFDTRLPRFDIPLHTDRRAFSQIVLNLASNAVKYTDSGNVLMTLSAIDDASPDQAVQVIVTDTGCGIKEADQPKLFQAFTQVDASSTRRHEGTGLGLHLSQKLAELLGAKITFRSEYGRGSTFTLTIRNAAP